MHAEMPAQRRSMTIWENTTAKVTTFEDAQSVRLSLSLPKEPAASDVISTAHLVSSVIGYPLKSIAFPQLLQRLESWTRRKGRNASSPSVQ